MAFEITQTDPKHPGVRAMVFSALDELARRYGRDADDESLNFDELNPPNGAFFVAREEGHLCGGVAVRSIGDPKAMTLEVKRLWVRPDLRKRGLARLLMSAAEDWSRSAGYREIYLETGEGQPEAIAFYPTVGYVRVDAFPDGVHNYHEGLKFHKFL
jgi:GNAT superfamily N-acetyltransferase